jgi:hypothetical protein
MRRLQFSLFFDLLVLRISVRGLRYVICLLFGVTSNRAPYSKHSNFVRPVRFPFRDRCGQAGMPIPSIRASYRPGIVRRT